MDKVDSKPAFTRAWFWDTNYDKIDWQDVYKSVIARILEEVMKTNGKSL